MHIFLPVEIPGDDHVGDQVEITDVDGHKQGYDTDCKPVVGHTCTVNDCQDRQYGEPEQDVQ
ncbi:hypothetical protein D3C86_1987950 [compost metagenome]